MRKILFKKGFKINNQWFSAWCTYELRFALGFFVSLNSASISTPLINIGISRN